MKKIAIILILAGVICAKPVDVENIEMFQNLLKQPNKLMVFELYADWCRACRVLKPILTEVSNENQDESVQFYRVDIDKFPQIAQAFQARGIPHTAFFKDGKYLDRLIGVHSKEIFEKAIVILNK